MILALSTRAASFSPLQIGILGDKCQLVAPETPVIGLRLALPFAINDTAAGLDLGILSVTEKSFTGVRLSAISWSSEGPINGVSVSLFDVSDINGIQLAGLGIALDVRGLQMGLNPHARAIQGVQLGLINCAGDRNGLQLGLLNLNDEFFGRSQEVSGVQLGLVNQAGPLRGLQIGLLNHASSLRGVQLGLLNIDRSSAFPYLPLLRFSL